MRHMGVIAIAVLGIAACGTPSQVRFETDGLHYESGPIAVRFAVPEKREFIDAEWSVDNWKYLEGSPSTGSDVAEAIGRNVCKPPCFERKTNRSYLGTLRVDMDNDGHLEKYPTFFTDLELRHAETEGRIWVLMRELPAHRAAVNVDVLVDNYAENLSFEEYSRTGPYDAWGDQSRAYAAQVVSRESVMFGPYEAILATIELANVAQLQLDPKSRMGFIRVLIARVPGFSTNVIPMHKPYMVPRSNVGLLIVGYFASSAYFEKGLFDFDAFLGRFTVEGQPVKLVRTTHAPAVAPLDAPQVVDPSPPVDQAAP
jgi:hypothetical protein